MSTVVMHNVVSVDGQHLLEDPEVVILGDRVLHLRYKVRRWPPATRSTVQPTERVFRLAQGASSVRLGLELLRTASTRSSQKTYLTHSGA